jgi:hypothetical protein
MRLQLATTAIAGAFTLALLATPGSAAPVSAQKAGVTDAPIVKVVGGNAANPKRKPRKQRKGSTTGGYRR